MHNPFPTTCRYYSAGAMVLYLADKLSRGIKSACLLVPEQIEWHAQNGITMLRMSLDCAPTVNPGQYFFVNIPQLALNEW